MAGEGDTAKVVAVEDYEKEVEKRQRAEAESVDLKKRLDAFKDVDLEKVRANEEALDRLTKENISGDPEKLQAWQTSKEAEIKGRFDKKLGEVEDENKTLKDEINRLKVINPALSKAAGMFVSSEIDTVAMHVERDLFLQDGEIRVRGKDGKPLPSIKNPRVDMDLTEYLEGLAEKHPVWALPTQTAGSKQGGTTTPGTPGAGITAQQYAQMTPEQRQEIPQADRGKLAMATLKQASI